MVGSVKDDIVRESAQPSAKHCRNTSMSWGGVREVHRFRGPETRCDERLRVTAPAFTVRAERENWPGAAQPV